MSILLASLTSLVVICKLVKSIFFFLLLYYREQWLGVHVLVERSWRLTAGRASHAAVWLSEYTPGWRSRNVQKTSRVCPSMTKTVTVPSLFVSFLDYSPWKKSSRLLENANCCITQTCSALNCLTLCILEKTRTVSLIMSSASFRLEILEPKEDTSARNSPSAWN